MKGERRDIGGDGNIREQQQTGQTRGALTARESVALLFLPLRCVGPSITHSSERHCTLHQHCTFYKITARPAPLLPHMRECMPQGRPASAPPFAVRRACKLRSTRQVVSRSVASSSVALSSCNDHVLVPFWTSDSNHQLLLETDSCGSSVSLTSAQPAR